jgi:16S rRNA (guanine527-N7)-methyltransferase
MGSIRQQLSAGAKSLNTPLAPDQCEKMLAFVSLLLKWNKKVNLTSVTEPSEVVSRHILDSLSAACHIEVEHTMDLGSGGGVPGIPLAILQPDRHFVLLDSRSKRTNFLRQATIELDLANVEIVRSRVQDYRSAMFDTVLVRAFGSLADIASAALHLLKETGIILAMKGQLTDVELSQVPENIKVREIYKVSVPGISGDRNLAIMARHPGQETR